jgi:hypothetical protein
MQDDQYLRAKLEAAIAQGQHLRDEVQQLKAILARHSIPLPEPKIRERAGTRYLPAPSEVAQIATIADNAAKIALFRSLFRGREDIYSERWRTEDGAWAYRPAGRKNWLAVLASRPEEYRKVDRETRTLFALTDEVIRQHLTGKKTIGCSWTKPAGFWQRTLTRKRGMKIRWHSSPRANGLESPPIWSDHDPGWWSRLDFFRDAGHRCSRS